jgi:hypothetical protein
MNLSIRYVCSLLSLILAIIGTTMMMAGGSISNKLGQMCLKGRKDPIP